MIDSDSASLVVVSHPAFLCYLDTASLLFICVMTEDICSEDSSPTTSSYNSPRSIIDMKYDASYLSEYNGSPESPLSSPEPPSVMQEPKSLLSTVSVISQ